MSNTVTITSTLKKSPALGKAGRLRFENIKNAVLGRSYTLSLAFVGNQRMQTLNKRWRKKDKPTNVLAFPLSDTEGEIVIAPDYAKHEAHHFQRTHKQHLAALLIHGCLHLKGYKHGRTMDKKEEQLQKKFLA